MSIWDKLNDTAPGTGADAWIPENEGDAIAGVVTGFQKGQSDYGEFDIVVLDKMDPKGNATGEEITVAMLGTVLGNAFQKHREAGRLKVGAELAVRYDGMEKAKSGNDYKAYTVLCTPPKSIGEQMASTPKGGDGLPF